MTVEAVLKIAGTPNRRSVERTKGEYERIRLRDLTHGQVVRSEECWFYKTKAALDGAGACFFKGRVLDVVAYTHG